MRGKYCIGIIILGISIFLQASEAQLQEGFYSNSCPKAEKIVKDYVKQHIHNAPSVAAAVLRMHFHDCFVRVCLQNPLICSTISYHLLLIFLFQ